MSENLFAGYVEILRLSAQMQNSWCEMIKLELDKNGFEGISPQQALMLYYLGDQEVSIKDLVARGYASTGNPSYSVSKLAQRKFLITHQSKSDKRSIRVRLGENGYKVTACIKDMTRRHSAELARGGMKDEQINFAILVLQRLSLFMAARERPKF
ncbi:MAG: helix-turn-helix domain-containing protein [Pseudomonadota bacterium]